NAGREKAQDLPLGAPRQASRCPDPRITHKPTKSPEFDKYLVLRSAQINRGRRNRVKYCRTKLCSQFLARDTFNSLTAGPDGKALTWMKPCCRESHGSVFYGIRVRGGQSAYRHIHDPEYS